MSVFNNRFIAFVCDNEPLTRNQMTAHSSLFFEATERVPVSLLHRIGLGVTAEMLRHISGIATKVLSRVPEFSQRSGACSKCGRRA
jgi:hypothetical protein